MINPYDQVPYPNYAYSYTHPDTLATLATLLSLTPAPVDRCRVLELGCASGGNLIPMAYTLPASEFVGLDYSGQQIAAGQAVSSTLDLRNITFKQLDIRDIATHDLGEFDYIIVHGIFSWVPPDVQAAIFETCRCNLAPNGVAYISYNTYPGWHMLGAIREMMLYHTRDVSEPSMQAAQARALLDFLVESIPSEGNPHGSLLGTYGGFLRLEMDRMKTNTDNYLLHDELEDINEPIYFHEFAERAAQHGLQYLTEVDFSTVLPMSFPPPVSANLFKLARDVIEMEQYMDFLRNRTFRKTLLVHAAVNVHRMLRPDRLMNLYLASRAQAVSESPDLTSLGVEKFRSADGATLTTDHPVTKVAMTQLRARWPQAMHFSDLLAAARTQLGLDPSSEKSAIDAQALAANLLKAYAYSGNLVELHVHPARFTTDVSACPRASPWARLQADEPGQITNLRHERVELDEMARFLLRHLDGTRDRAALFNVVAKPLRDGTLVVRQGDQPVEDLAQAEAILAEELDTNLHWLAQVALLVE
jgi:methyltransferase-like protein